MRHRNIYRAGTSCKGSRSSKGSKGSEGSKGERAFTLIELLVVISIIAVLAAILLPVMGNAKRNANQVKSAGNLRQWGVALGLSLTDNNGMLPWEGQPVTRTEANAWYNRLPPYFNEKPYSSRTQAELPKFGQKSIFVNPQVPAAVFKQYSPYIFCYAMNYNLSTTSSAAAQDPANDLYFTMPMLRIEKPSALIFMGEKGDDFANLNPGKVKAYFGPGNIETDVRNRANFVYCDGHVKAFTRKQFDPNFNAKVTSVNPIDSTLTYVAY